MIKLTDKDILFFNSIVDEMISHEKVRGMTRFHQHGDTCCLKHSVAVAFYSYLAFKKMNIKCDFRSLLRGAILHDFFLYDWHSCPKGHELHGFTHPKTALKNAEKNFSLNKIERNIIKSHMWPLTIRSLPRHREAVMVCVVDKICTIFETLSPFWKSRGYRKEIYRLIKNSKQLST